MDKNKDIIISTKGFDNYKFIKDGEEWWEIFDIMSKRELIRHIKKCILTKRRGGNSSHHDALTQICFGCKKIRTTIRRVE